MVALLEVDACDVFVATEPISQFNGALKSGRGGLSAVGRSTVGGVISSLKQAACYSSEEIAFESFKVP